MASVEYKNNTFLVEIDSWDNNRVKNVPNMKWTAKEKKWCAPAVGIVARGLVAHFSEIEISDDAKVKIAELQESIKVRNVDFPAWYAFKNPPMKHQKEALNKAWMKNEFAFLMEMRCGKTFTDINLAAAYAMQGDINAWLIVVPSSIKLVWEDEIAEHCPIPTNVFTLEAGNKGFDRFMQSDEPAFKVMIMGVEALSQGLGWKYAERFLLAHTAKVTVDESSRIKKHDSIRTAKCWELGELAKMRTILTGTPITQGMQDLFAQYYFLNWGIVGMKTFFSFRNRYCIMGGFEGRKVVGYDNVKELMEYIEPYTYQVLAKDVYDLPPVVMEQRYVKPTKNQLEAMKELQDVMMTSDGTDNLEVQTVLERVTRYQQIAGGSFPYNNEERASKKDNKFNIKPISGKNPKLEGTLEVIEDIPEDQKIIIWARFRPEIDRIQEALRKKYGNESVVEFHGGIDPDGKRYAKHSFQDPDSPVRFFVSNQGVGGMGLELSAASYMIYFSNDFSYENRKQSMARNMSGKQTAESLCVIDIVLEHKVDKMIFTAMSRKQSMAAFVQQQLSN